MAGFIDTILWICGGLAVVAGMIIGALKVGEKSGKQKEQLRQEQENQANEKARNRIDDTVRRTPAEQLRDDFYRD